MHSGGNASSLPLVGGAPEPTINQLSKPGRRASRFPKLDVPVTEIKVIQQYEQINLVYRKYQNMI